MVIDPRSKSVLITGASTGIGRITALHLEKLGFTVFATVRRPEDCLALHEASTGLLVPVLMDVVDPASIQRTREEIERHTGPAGLWGLVNNAAVAFSGPWEVIPLEQLRYIFEVNFFGLLAVTQAMLPMLRQAQGRVVNISSTATLMRVQFHGPYTTSKLSVNGLTDSLRQELKPFGMRVSNVICGSIQTPMWERGTQTSSEIFKAAEPELKSLYYERYHTLGEYLDRLGRNGVLPEAAAAAIARALTDENPKFTYPVGADARLFMFAHLVPARLLDWIRDREIGFKR